MITVTKQRATTHSATVSDMLGRVRSYTDRWAKTTTSTYDSAGRRTARAGPGSVTATFDNAGRVLTQSLDGALMATAGYDGGGELATVAYNAGLNGGNGTSLAIVRHPGTGMVTKPTWTGPGGTLATDEVARVPLQEGHRRAHRRHRRLRGVGHRRVGHRRRGQLRLRRRRTVGPGPGGGPQPGLRLRPL